MAKLEHLFTPREAAGTIGVSYTTFREVDSGRDFEDRPNPGASIA